MHFSKILPVTLLAALAVAAPAPQGASVPVSQIRQFSENVQSFAGTTDSEFNKVKGQQESLANAWQGEGAVSLNCLVSLIRPYSQPAASPRTGLRQVRAVRKRG